MAKESTNVQVRLENVRLSFAHVFRAQKPKPDKDGNVGAAKFNCSFLLDKKSATGKKNIEKMKAAMVQARDNKWPKNPPKIKPDKMCMRDGDQEDWDGYEGMYYVSASNSKRPKILDRDKTPLTEEDGKIYSGCYVNGIVNVWCQDNEHGKRINASLEGIQFVKNGEAFGAAPLDDDAFDDLGQDEDDDESDGKGSSARRGRSLDDDDGDGDDLLG